ncbi:ankyrin repeat domain-containing protein [Aspergillus candidus]|uniref:Ankyrin n=1 Tax=Aspergillus candidus TaxID=41067 RepID=A0A2I2F441_ASPCN|nr:ankyrin [Aspergillus candidus]PLB35336.1 ankyrin [Aspergillus candidus]
MSNSRTFSVLPCELLLEIAEYLRPCHLVDFMMALPNLAYIMPRRLVARDDGFVTVLGYMAQDRGSAEICRRLIPRMEIDVNYRLRWDNSALDIAIRRQHDVMVDLLLARPDIEVNRYGEPTNPLYHAASTRCIPSLRKLLARKDVDLNTRTVFGWTALGHATVLGYTKVVELLLKAPGIVIEPEESSLATPLSLAAERGYRGIVRLLLPLAHQTDATGTPLVDINARSHRSRTPLIRATLTGKSKVVQLLLEHDLIDVNARDRNGRTALSHAAQMGYLTIMRLLLARPDIDVRENNSRRRTPLAHAAARGLFKTCRMLLEHPDIEPHARDSTGRTPLIHAVQSGSVQVFRLLLNQCANGEEDWKDRTGRGAWDHAELKKRTEMMNIFVDYQFEKQAGSYDENDAMDEGDESNDSDAMDEGED